MTHWQTVDLDKVARIDRSSIAPEKIKRGTSYLGLEHIVSGGRIINAQIVSNGELKSSKFQFTPEHLLYGKLRPYLAKIALPDFHGICSTDIIPILPGPDLNRKFLVYFLRQDSMVEYANSRSTGANLPRLSPKELAKFTIPLPPLAEQKRIAAILDAADALRAKRRETLAQLDTLLQSTFLDMFGDPVTNPKGWEKRTLKETFNFSTGKLDSNAAVVGGCYPFFTCSRETYAINDFAFDCEALLLAGNNANADYSVKHYKGKFNAYQRTYVITVDNSLVTYEYSKVALDYLLTDLKRFSKGTNTKYLTMVILNRMPILVPPLALQQHFATIVESIEQQKTRLRTHLAELDTLFASLQSRAFNGEL